MNYDPLFELDENKVLLAVSARRIISNIGYGGIVWGLINIGIGALAIRYSMVNVAVLMLGILMLAGGVQALRAPSLNVLLGEAILAGMLFVWNLGVLARHPNPEKSAEFSFWYLLVPAIIVITFFQQYRRLRPVKALVSAADPGLVKATEEMCKALLKKKPKNEPNIVVASDSQFRAELMADRAFFVDRTQTKIFVAQKSHVGYAAADPEAKKLTLTFRHPLGAVKLKFDKANSEKIKAWLSKAADAPGGTPASASEGNVVKGQVE